MKLYPQTAYLPFNDRDNIAITTRSVVVLDINCYE